YQAPADGVEHLRDARVKVVGGEPTEFSPRGTVTLPKMRPGEDRWVEFAYTLDANTDDKMIPVTFTVKRGGRSGQAFTFGIQPSSFEAAARRNLELHAGVFNRLATVFGVKEGKAEGAAAADLVAQQDICHDRYLTFLKEHARTIRAGASRLIEMDKADRFGAQAALKE